MKHQAETNNWLNHYLLNCFVLFLPILVWNIFLSGQLPGNYQPAVFSKGIPGFLIYGEQISRFGLFAIAFLMPLSISSQRQKIGFYIYLLGLVLYFVSWILLIHFPNGWWSKSAIGFSAPALTPALWLLGISLIGSSFYFDIPFRSWSFIAVSAIFLVFHISHTIVVFNAVN